MANPAVVVDFVANTKDLQDGFNKASGSAKGFGDKLKGIAKGGAIAGIGALAGALKIGVEEFVEASKVGAQTEAVIKSTGGVAKVSAKHVDALAEALMKKSGVDDEAIASGENLLLTFTNIRNGVGKNKKIFDEATGASLDMSVALGTDMKSAAQQVGKALNDPEKGLGKLSRAGVTFTEAQEKQIKKLQESGDMMGAQKIILGELKKEFGGSAEAAGKTLPGQLNVLKQSFSNLAGDLVAKMVPAVQAAIGWLRDHWPKVSAAFDTMWAVVKPILDNLWDLLKEVAGVIETVWPAVEPIVKNLGETVKAAGKIIATALKLVTDLIKGDWKAAWEDVKKIVETVIQAVKDRIRALVDSIKIIATALGKAIFNGVKDGVSGLVGWVGDRLGDIKDKIVGAATGVFNAAKKFGGELFDGLKNGVTGIAGWIGERIGNVIDTLTDPDRITRMFNKAKEMGLALFNGMKAGVEGIVGMAKSAIGAAINAVIDIINKFKIPKVKVAGKTIFPGWGGMNIKHVQLAEGGIVTRPTMAMIGEAGPEAVVPLTGAGAGIQVRVFIGDTELRGLVRTEIVDADTHTARTLLAGVH